MIITNRQTEIVVVSPTVHDEVAEGDELARSFRMLDAGFADIRAGRVQPAKQAIDEIAQEFALSLEHRPAHT